MASPSKKSFLLRLDEGMLNELRNLAEWQQMPLSRLLRNILEDYLEDVSLTKPQKEKETVPWWME
jgi:predicted DNA-binding protein